MRAPIRAAAWLLAAACLTVPTFALSAEAPLADGATLAHLVTPSGQPVSTIIDGRMWQCSGADCSAAASDSADSQSLMRECRRAARTIGAFDAYRTGSQTMDAAGLKTCDDATARRQAPASDRPVVSASAR